MEWKGELDANGNIKAGVPYFMVIKLKIKDGVDAGFWIQCYDNINVNGEPLINGNCSPIDADRQGFTLWHAELYKDFTKPVSSRRFSVSC